MVTLKTLCRRVQNRVICGGVAQGCGCALRVHLPTLVLRCWLVVLDPSPTPETSTATAQAQWYSCRKHRGRNCLAQREQTLFGHLLELSIAIRPAEVHEAELAGVWYEDNGDIEGQPRQLIARDM